MQALCERLQMLVETAKEISARPPAASSAQVPPPAPVACAAAAGALGTQLSRDGGVKVRAQNGGMYKPATTTPGKHLHDDGESGEAVGRRAEGGTGTRSSWREQDLSEGTAGTRSAWRVDDFGTASVHADHDKQAEADVPEADEDEAGESYATKSPKPALKSPISALKSPVSAVKKTDTFVGTKSAITIGEDEVGPKAAAGGKEGSDRGGATQRTTSGVSGGGAANKAARARKQFVGAVSKVKAMKDVVDEIKGPTVVGRKVGSSIGRHNHQAQAGKEQGHQSSAEVLREMMAKLALSWKSVGAIFNHFDRPDMEEDGQHKGDSEISLEEFALGIRKMKLDFTDDQIVEVFHLVDKDGSGTIDHSELEAVLRECGVLKSIAVQRVPKTVKMFEYERAEKKIEEEAKEEQDKKRKGGKPKKGQPIDIPGMSNQVAEGLHALEERVETLRGVMQEVRGNSNQFNLILEQYSKAAGDAEEKTRMQLLEAGEGLVQRMADGISNYKNLANEIHEFSVELIRDLPRDYRVVWKAAVCSEIDEKGGLVRVFNEEMYECEKEYLQMKEQCREWRVVDVKNPTLDFTVTKDADGPVGVSEGYAQTMQQAREWVKSAVGFGFAQQKDMVRKLESVNEHVDEDEVLDGKSLMGVTQALGEKLAPYVEESTARIAARLEERNAFARNAESSPQNGKRGDGMPSGKSANRSSTQASVRSQGRGAAASGQMSGASASAANALSVSMFASHANAQRRNKMSLVGGTDVNYEGMYQQLSLVQEMRSQFESGLEAADLSSIADTADTSIDSEVRQLVKTRLTQVSRDVKEAVAHSHPSTLAHAHAQSPTMPVSSAAATKQPSEVLEDASPGSQRPRLRARERNQLAKAAAEEARGQWASGAPRRDLGKGSPGKSVWKKLDEQIARHAQTLASGRARTGPGAKVEVAAPHVSLPQGTVRRTTKPPPDRIVSSTAVPKGLNTVSRHDGQARAHRSAHVPSDTRISRARTHVIPTATSSLLTRPSKNTVEGSADIMDKHLASSLLPPENPAAKALSDLQKAALEKMIFCGVTFEVHLPEAGVWTAVAEANFVRELSALLGVPTSDVGLDGRVSDLVPTTLHLELRHSKHLAGDIVDQVSVQAQDPSSLLWALPHLAKIMAQGMIFEKSAMHGSPPREDLFLEASADASPQLTSHAWEEVKAPMMREQSPDKDNMVASEACVDPDLTKDRPALSPAGDAAARSRRSLDFHEISGSGISTPVIKHRKPELADRVRQSAPLPQDEESVTERVLNYLSHHILAHIESDSKFQTSSTWRDEDPLKDLDELRRERRLAGACSPFIAGLLGSEGLMLLTQAGIDVDDDSVLELAEANILEEARRAFRKKRQGDDVEALPANEEGLSELPQPGLGRRPVVLRESTQPFKTGNTAHQDEQAEELILSMLLALMETAEEEDPEVQAALDAETRLYLAAKEEEAQRQAAFAKARQLDDDTRQSVASLLSQDGDGAMVTAEEPAAGDGVQSSSEIETGSVVQEAVRELAHQPPPIAFDNERVERHHQLVEDTLVRIADSMDALTNLTMHLASAAERAPATLSYPPHQPAVGAVHVHSGQSPALHSAYSGGDFAVGESVVRSASTSPPSDDSPSSAIVESDYTPPKSADSDEAWTPVQGRTVNDQDVQTSIDFDVQAAMRELTSGFAHRPQLETHSAQTSIDFDAMYPNLRTRSRGRAEAVNQQLQTSFDFDDAASSSRLVASSTNTSAPPSPAKALKAHPVEPAGVTSASQLTEPLTHTLISTLQSVAEEVALLRESRLVQQSPGAARSREVALGAAEGGEREHESAGRESAQASSAVPLQEWLRLDTSHVDAGKQVCQRTTPLVCARASISCVRQCNVVLATQMLAA